MKAWITKSFGDYVFKIKDHDLNNIRCVASIVSDVLHIEVTERL